MLFAKLCGVRGTFMVRLGKRSLLAALLAVAVGVYLLPSPIDPKPHRWVRTFLSSCHQQICRWRFSFPGRLKGPPPALEGPLAVNTRLQKGHRLFSGKLHGPESFTADGDGESSTNCRQFWKIRTGLRSSGWSLLNVFCKDFKDVFRLDTFGFLKVNQLWTDMQYFTF